MATTDTRSGFRLPWSSDRSHDAHTADETVPTADETAPETGPDATPAWPSGDMNESLGLVSQPRPAAPSAAPAAAHVDAAVPPDAQEPAMIEVEPTPQPAPVAPRKPSKLMVDLTAAIRSTAVAARDQALTQVDVDVARVVETIRSGSKEGEDALRVRSDEDIAQIKEWSRAEIARIKEETERRIDARRTGLDEELAAHAAAIEQRVGEVEVTAADYRAEMEAYSERLASEEDPSRLATMAESMPEPPVLDTLADLDDLEIIAPVKIPESFMATVAAVPYEPVVDAVVEAEPVVDTFEAEPVVDTFEAEPVVDTFEAEPEPIAEPEAAATVETFDAEPEPIAEPVAEPEFELDAEFGPEAHVEPVAEPDLEAEAVAETFDTETFDTVAPEAVAFEADVVATEPTAPAAKANPWGEPEAASAWVASDSPWGARAQAAPAWEIPSAGQAVDNVPHWAAGETPDGFPTGDGTSGDPVDRGAIMAALEAAAEAVVAAESAAESADQAEAAADVAETAAELLKGRVDGEEEVDPEAQAALSARMGAGGIEESYTDRLASLMPGHGEGAADGEPRTTQVVVSGLVSVASIASFKRHLGRLGGVKAVAVASGPDGEFVFNVTHRPDVSFRDAVPTMPGFAARVTSTGDGVVQVTARDPEAEG